MNAFDNDIMGNLIVFFGDMLKLFQNISSTIIYFISYQNIIYYVLKRILQDFTSEYR